MQSFEFESARRPVPPQTAGVFLCSCSSSVLRSGTSPKKVLPSPPVEHAAVSSVRQARPWLEQEAQEEEVEGWKLEEGVRLSSVHRCKRDRPMRRCTLIGYDTPPRIALTAAHPSSAIRPSSLWSDRLRNDATTFEADDAYERDRQSQPSNSHRVCLKSAIERLGIAEIWGGTQCVCRIVSTRGLPQTMTAIMWLVIVHLVLAAVGTTNGAGRRIVHALRALHIRRQTHVVEPGLQHEAITRIVDQNSVFARDCFTLTERCCCQLYSVPSKC